VTRERLEARVIALEEALARSDNKRKRLLMKNLHLKNKIDQLERDLEEHNHI
jgi:hypothetical protein